MKKLRCKKGFTLSELLVTVVMLAILTLAVAVGISSSIRVYHQSVTISEAGILSSTLCQAISDELHYAKEIDASGGTVKFLSDNYGRKTSITTNADGRLMVGTYPLIGNSAYTHLNADVAITYSDAAKSFDVTLIIKEKNNVVSTRSFQISPLNV